MRSIRLKTAAAPSLVGAMVASLIGCGGGGDGASPPAPHSLPTPTVLSSSSGVMSRYTGRWSAGCGLTILSAPVQSVQNTYEFGAPAATSVQGTLTQRQFTDMNCLTPFAATNVVPVREAVTVTFVASVNAGTPTTAFDNFTGTADQVILATQTSSGNPSSSTSYVAFQDNFTVLRIRPILPFSASDLTYPNH